MKIKYTLETLQEFKNAASNVRLENDPLPSLTGTLEPCKQKDGKVTVELLSDPNFQFSMNFKDFVIQVCDLAGIKLLARDFIPTS